MALPVAADAGGLKHNLSSWPRPPSRGGVEGIAFRQFLDAAMAAEFDADIRRAVLVQDTKDHVARFARHRDMPDLRAVIIPEPAFIGAELADFEQGAEAAAF